MQPITNDALRVLPGPNQIFLEWKTYLIFAQIYFKRRNITSPIVVEIGTQNGHQKMHYETFLDAEHIGIDISQEWSRPDILGNSHAPETVDKLKAMLQGRPINLLFIDALHAYRDAGAEYETYGPLTADIIAFHDIRHVRGIGDLWRDIQAGEKGNRNLTFMEIGAWGTGWCELGIGLIVKRGKDELRDILDEFKHLYNEQEP